MLIVCAIVDQQEEDRSFWTLATNLIKDGDLSFNGPKLQSQQRCTDGGWVGWSKVGGLTTHAYYECIFVYHLHCDGGNRRFQAEHQGFHGSTTDKYIRTPRRDTTLFTRGCRSAVCHTLPVILG